MANKSKHHFKNGDVYSFKTSPFNKFSNPDTGRYACLKILTPVICMGEIQTDCVGFIVFDKIFTHPPTITEVNYANHLKCKRFSHGNQSNSEPQNSIQPPLFSNQSEYALSSTAIGWENDLLEFSFIGTIAVTPVEEQMRQDLRSFSTWNMASHEAEGEWRWENDKVNLIAEYAMEQEEEAKTEQLAKERYENRLSKLTWEIIEDEIFFQRWENGSPFPSIDFTNRLRFIIKTKMLILKNLGTKPKRAEVRKVMKKMVQEITALDSEYEGVIETEERGDIYELFYDLTHLTKQSKLIDEIGDWHYGMW